MLTEEIVDSSVATKLALISGESGFGKSALLSQSTKQIREVCANKSAAHIILMHVCYLSFQLNYKIIFTQFSRKFNCTSFKTLSKEESNYKEVAAFYFQHKTFIYEITFRSRKRISKPAKQ